MPVWRKKLLNDMPKNPARCSQELAAKEGIFVGISSHATFTAALQVAKDAPDGATILCMLPDNDERYFSTPLFADMTDEEVALSHSTPGFHLAAAAAD